MKPIIHILQGWASLIRLPGPPKGALRLTLAAISLLLLLGLLGWLLLGGTRWLPARFWQLAALCTIALGVLWWFLVGARRLSRRGLARKHAGDLAPGDVAQETATLEAMRASVRQARQTILRSPEIGKGREPLYRIPWLLFVGDAAAEVHGLLQTASASSPFPGPATAAALAPQRQPWQWWFFKSMIAIETAPELVCDSSARRERGIWYHALLQLAQEREHLPLNGIVVCVGAATLQAGTNAIKPVAMRLRRLVDETLEHLQLQLPVYLVVTGLEKLPGYTPFRDMLPPEALQRALGHCLPGQQAVSAATSAELDAVFAPIAERLHALRLTALRQQHEAAGRRAIFEFVRQFGDLQSGLQSLVQLMLEDNPFQRTPRWRGLYFTAAGAEQAGQAPAGGAFTADLFTRFLPADQPLASASLKGRAGRMGVAAIGVAAMLGFSTLLAHSLQGVRQDDSALLAQTRSACLEPSDAGASSRIAWVAHCGRAVEQLEAAQQHSGLGFGLRRADQSIASTKQTLLRDFSNLILAPYEQVIEADLARGLAGVEHLLAISQRLRLLENCRQRTDACGTIELVHNTAFDPRARVYSPFLSGEQDVGFSRRQADALFTTYLGYLRWQSPGALDAETRRLQAVLARLLAHRIPSVEQLQQWAQARFDDVQLRDFWLPEDRVVGSDEAALARVSAAFTLPVWQGHMQPMLATASRASPQHAAALAALRGDYLHAYQRAWGQFNARFQDGQQFWRGAHEQLVARAAQPRDNPYHKLDQALQEHVLALPLQLPLASYWQTQWAQARQNWLGAWRPLGRFIGQGSASVANGLTSPWWTEPRQPPAAWVPAWLESRAALDTEAVRNATARSYLRLAQKDNAAELYQDTAGLFRSLAGGAAAIPGQAITSPGAQDLALLLLAAEKPPDRYATRFSGDDLQAWSIVQGPARLVLSLAMQRTGSYLQARWRESVHDPLQGLPPPQRREQLNGPNGRLAAFTKDWLAPFVTDTEHAPRQVAGVQLPLAPAFVGMLAAARQFQPADPLRAFPAGFVQFQGPSRFGRQSEGTGGSQLEIVCQDRSFGATSQGESLADGRTQVFWAPQSCPQVRLRIALPDPPPGPAADPAADDGLAGMPSAQTATPAAQAPRLTLLYQGTDSFPALLRDFRSGSHTFTLADFRDSYTPAQWAQLQPALALAGITQVRVFLSVVPTAEMERHLAGAGLATELPENILES
ncbi:hypothetical protein D8I35_15735 [Corticibacter populi]|uniref:Type VI secretion system component TssM1 N-terminal domain-containing protein n=1 Tax=Corticibacter populi TaxID=1550736 RepID=A0A3M6QME3_9BURK|nr:type VI secretion protein IcmF/TssM N-terminal domain-containing protein [Corticibacter populi]RMX04240.1 hypothetical protein D8I35_15735 [Corticibacter populi]RZS33278.1 type VI protein secretion system component VasK [Corticibacter populi]